MNDLTICQVCKEKPATYGDGLTWSRCSECQFKWRKDNKVQEPKEQPGTESFEHKIIEGLVSIILPVHMNNYTLFHYTGNCIGSIREHTVREDYELVIVDNGSTIKPPELESYYANKVIVNEENLGVTKAWNQGIRMSVGEYIVLMNNDVQVYRLWLPEMMNLLHEGADFVMAHPMYSLTEPFARATESLAALKGEKKFDDIPGNKDWSCVMFKRSLIEEIGGFDERFFNYCSDTDFFRRMDEAGKKYVMSSTVFTSHISDATGFSIAETPDIMNKDKAKYEEKLKGLALEKLPEVFDVTYSHLKMGDKIIEGLVRAKSNGDPIYLLLAGKYHHVGSPEVLHALGADFGDEMLIENLDGFESGEDLTMENYKNYV
jgi:GT2 family glycosyltransferase